MTEKQAVLKERIDQGFQPFVKSCTYSSTGFSMGDLVEIGYARKRCERDREGCIENLDWFYLGPKPIVVAKYDGWKVVNPDEYISGQKYEDHYFRLEDF